MVFISVDGGAGRVGTAGAGCWLNAEEAIAKKQAVLRRKLRKDGFIGLEGYTFHDSSGHVFLVLTGILTGHFAVASPYTGCLRHE
jgi:hypothetical protein